MSSIPMLFSPLLEPAESATPQIAPSSDVGDNSLREAKIITIIVIGFASLFASFAPWLISRKCVRHADCILLSAASQPTVNLRQLSFTPPMIFSKLTFRCILMSQRAQWWRYADFLPKTHLERSLITSINSVVLGAALSHLMPDADEHFREYYGEGNEYPFMSLYAGSSLMVLWLIERLLLGNHSHSVEHDHSYESEIDEETPIPTNSTTGPNGEIVDLNQVDKMPRSDIQQLTHLMKPFIEAIVFLVALSMHSLFEGLGLGAENDTKGVFTTIVAVASHKALEAFALGLAIHRAKLTTWKSIVLIVLYALATPIGGIIGLVASHLADDGTTKVVSGVLVSLAAGSFLYISLIEILPKELEKHTSRPKTLIKLALMLFGWGFMVFIAKFA